MMKPGVFLSLLIATAVSLLTPAHLHATTFRAPELSAPGPLSSPPGAPPAGAADIRDIYGPLHLPAAPPYPLIAGLVLLAAAAAGAAFWLVRRRRRHQAPYLPDPADQALAALHRAEMELPETGGHVFADAVSHILRGYIESVFAVRSTRQTTTEFFARLGTGRTGSGAALVSHADLLQQCLSLCDMVKFAGFTPPPDRATALGSSVRSFIEMTSRTPGPEI